MFYPSDVINDILKCAGCKRRFTIVVKIVADCGNSICGMCYEELLQSTIATHSSDYECKACSETHVLPRRGLTDNLSLLRMLDVRPEERALSEKAKALKSLIVQVQDELMKLRSFDKAEEISAHCESLVIKAYQTFESRIDHLKSLKDDLLLDIEGYRSELLDYASAAASPGRTPKRAKTSSGAAELNQRELMTLTTEADEFERKWSEYFNRLTVTASDSDLDQAHAIAHHQIARAHELKEAMILDAFGDKVLDFEENRSFCEKTDHIGKLVFKSTSNPQPTCGRLSERVLFSLDRHLKTVHQAVFLPGGQIASCSDDKTIRVTNLADAVSIRSIMGHSSGVLCLASLPGNRLASSSFDKTIKIWDLEANTISMTLRGHTSGVFSIALLKNGRLASCSWDGSLKIWNIDSVDGDLVRTIVGHEVESYGIGIGLLSNGTIVTVSNDAKTEKDSVLKIWDPTDGRLVVTISTHSSGACSARVLRDDSIAVGFTSGRLVIIDESKSRTLPKCHQGSLMAIEQLGARYLLTGGARPDLAIRMWDHVTFTLLRTIENAHCGDIYSLNVSDDSRLLASTSTDKKVHIWQIHF